jgi:uncharacterized protein (DUF1800 family)
MLKGEAPLTERMTLFWHQHFTVKQRKVRSPQILLRQNQLLRRHALGNYADLLRAIVVDPAMLDQIARHAASLPVLDARSADEILGYDAQGLPS